MRPYNRRVSVPKGAHPLVRALFAEMDRQSIGVLDMAERAGIGKHTLKQWRTRSNPRIPDLEACFNVLGMQIIATPEGGNRQRTGAQEGADYI